MEIEPNKKFRTGKDLPSLEKDAFIHLLQTNMDIFTWSVADLLGINPFEVMYALALSQLARKHGAWSLKEKSSDESPEIAGS